MFYCSRGKPVECLLTIDAERDVDNQTSIDVENPVEDPVPETKPAEGRGQRIWKKTEYVRLLKEGSESGVTGSRGGGVLPRGMRPGTSSVGGDGDGTDHATAVNCEEVDYAMAAVVESAEDLQPTYEEARKRPDWPKWQEAIQKELKSLEKMGTYQLVKWPPGSNIVDSRWVFRIKNAAGEIDKYKARLVAKGFTQIYGVNYYETYAPVARLTSFRLLLALAAQNGWVVDIFDFDSAYLNSKLGDDEVIYLEQPAGYETKDRRGWVWRLLKALYGLKQGAKNWYDTLHRALIDSVRKSSSVRFFCLIWTDRNRNRLPILARPKKTGLNRKKPVQTSPNQSKPHFPRFYHNK